MRQRNNNPKISRGLVMVMLVLITIQLACNGDNGTGEPQPAEPTTGAKVTISGYDIRKNKSKVWSTLNSINDFQELTDISWYDLIKYGKVTTDIAGQAELCPDNNINNTSQECTDEGCRIYVFDSSGLQINTCQEVDLGADFCSEQGTQTFDECHVTVVTLSGNVTGLGTWFSMTYLWEQELTLLIVAEGNVEIVPVIELSYTYDVEGGQITVLEIDERILDDQQRTSINVDPSDNSEGLSVVFYYTAPDDKLEELGLWELPEVTPRTPLPISELPILVERLEPLEPRIGPWIEKIFDQAQTDGVIRALPGTEASYKLGLSISTLNNPFFVTLRDGAQEVAEQVGVELVVVDAQDDSAIEATNIEDLIQSGVDALLINPTDADAIVPSIQKANEANIPVFTVDREAIGGTIISHIASDNVVGGEMAGEFLCEALQGAGNVVELEGIAGTSAARDRGMGFNDYMINECPGVEIVARQTANFNRAEGLTVFENILQAQPEIDGSFAHNDEMILGAIEAAEAAGRADMIIFVGFDAIDDAVNAVEVGNLAATIAQQPALMGRLSVIEAIRFLNGEQVQGYIPVDLSLVTLENIP